ncbi:MAG TPA: hypothetical protein VKQ36_03805, partial [Ktedonobacterales bacterium]|nr:hypothetical protein [Ktedonobacterales bacterium]
MSKRSQQKPTHDPAKESFEAGCRIVAQHPLFAPLWYWTRISRVEGNPCPKDGWVVVSATSSLAVLAVHPTRRGDPEEWAYALAHCLLHLGFGHFKREQHPQEWNDACCWFLAGFQRQLKFGRPPAEMLAPGDAPATNEERIYEELCVRGLPRGWQGCGAAGAYGRDMIIDTDLPGQKLAEYQKRFAEGLAAAVAKAVEVAAGEIATLTSASPSRTEAQRAREWFINSYPLLGALAAAFTIVEDPLVCQRLGISIAAVDPESREIFINPAANLNQDELRFVMAHELLHVGLRHDARQQGRDPYLWNVSCDFIINAWLAEMNVGVMPQVGALYDSTLKGESAEAVYDRIVTDLRRYRKLRTMRGIGESDIILRGHPDWSQLGAGVDLDTFYRNALSQGLSYHRDEGRGLLPAGLIEEIQALSQPPIPWDVELARWFDAYFQPVEFVRSYARPSRRQSATPDIPRPRWVPPLDWEDGRTFGVVLDTSGSMDRKLLAKALGAIASYSLSRDVPIVRVVFCDAATYDQGYMRPED